MWTRMDPTPTTMYLATGPSSSTPLLPHGPIRECSLGFLDYPGEPAPRTVAPSASVSCGLVRPSTGKLKEEAEVESPDLFLSHRQDFPRGRRQAMKHLTGEG